MRWPGTVVSGDRSPMRGMTAVCSGPDGAIRGITAVSSGEPPDPAPRPGAAPSAADPLRSGGLFAAVAPWSFSFMSVEETVG